MPVSVSPHSSDPTYTRHSTPAAWELMWKEKATPWDASEIQPAFREIVEVRWGEVEGVDWESLVDGGKGRALVPGCGRVSRYGTAIARDSSSHLAAHRVTTPSSWPARASKRLERTFPSLQSRQPECISRR